jgi:hypothetical protein
MADSAIIPDARLIAMHNSLLRRERFGPRGRTTPGLDGEGERCAVFTERAGEGSHRPPCATSMHRFPAEMR